MGWDGMRTGILLGTLLLLLPHPAVAADRAR